MATHTFDLNSSAEQQRIAHYESWGEDTTDQEREQAAQDDAIAKIQALGQVLIKKREEAREARKQCGIEDDWQEDEEFYQSIDKANPEGETNVGKPVSSEGGATQASQQRPANRSSIFIPLTRPYVDAAHAKVSDMLLPTDEWPFEFTTTKIPTSQEVPEAARILQPGSPDNPLKPVAEAAAGMPSGMMGEAAPDPAATAPSDASGPSMGAAGSTPPGMAGAMPMPAATPAPGAMPPGMPPGAAPGQPQAAPTDPDVVSGTKTPDEAACEKAKDHIIDWLTECQFHAEYRKMLENCAKLGTGVLKGPVPGVRISQKMVTGANGQKTMVRLEEDVPISVSVDPRNFFPDPACGEDVQRGSYVWEFDVLSGRKVQEFLEDDSYIQPMVAKVLREGPLKSGMAADVPASPQGASIDQRINGSATFPVWYFYGMVDRESLLAAGIEEKDLGVANDDVAVSVPAVVTIINDTVVKCALQPMDAGGFPYDVMPWQRRAGMIWGMGVARQMRTPQRMLNGAARALMDNAAFTSGPIVGLREKWIRGAAGKRIVAPREIFLMTEEAPDTAKIQDAISFTNIESSQQALENIVNTAIRFAEIATGLPLIMQGQQGEVQETATGRTIQNNNGSAVLRRIARQSDDCVMERHIRRYYQWLLENTDYDDAKGDLQIDCSASTALVDRELSNQTLVQLAPMLYQDPDVNKTKLNQEMLRAHRFDPKRIYKTDEEKRNTPAPPPPEKVQIAMINQKGATERTQLQIQHDQQQAEEQRHIDIAALEKDLNETLAAIAQAREANTENNKTRLAETVMKLRAMLTEAHQGRVHDSVQGQVARQATAVENATDRQHELATSTYEPVGRAPAGQGANR